MAYNGYQTEKTDISRPGLDSSNWSWRYDGYGFAKASGSVKNTGNVSLANITIIINYYNAANQLIATDSPWVISDTGYWSTWTNCCSIP